MQALSSQWCMGLPCRHETTFLHSTGAWATVPQKESDWDELCTWQVEFGNAVSYLARMHFRLFLLPFLNLGSLLHACCSPPTNTARPPCMAVWDNLFISVEDAIESLADTKADLEFVLHTKTLFLAWTYLLA